MYIYIICMYVCMYVYRVLSIIIYVCVCACMYIRMYVCMYVCICTDFLRNNAGVEERGSGKLGMEDLSPPFVRISRMKTFAILKLLAII